MSVAVVGDSGVGKSTLINAVLGEDRASTGVGDPVTSGVQGYQSPQHRLVMWDFEGFHHGGDQPRAQLRKMLKQVDEAGGRIDVAWFCWPASGHRITRSQRRLVGALHRRKIPVVAVVTKARGANAKPHPQEAAFADAILRSHLKTAFNRVFFTAAIDDDWEQVPKHGLDDLIRATRQAGARGRRR